MDKLWSQLLSQPSAEAFIHQAFDLKKVPELSVLDGIAERKDYHPEADCGIHMRMVMQQAFDLTEQIPCLSEKRKVRVRAAAALHDLGKAISGGRTTDEEGEYRLFDPEKASHLEHDKLGLPLVKVVAKRWDLSGDTTDLCLQVAKYHQQLHRLCEKDGKLDRGARTMLKNLMLSNNDQSEKKHTDTPIALAWRDREWVEDFSLAIQADSFGRLIPEEERVYPQRRLLLSTWDALDHTRHQKWPLQDKPLLNAMYSIMKTLDQWREEHEADLKNASQNAPEKAKRSDASL